MAEIHVQAKKKAGATWFWIVLLLVVVCAIVAFVMLRDDKQGQKNVRDQASLSIELRNAQLPATNPIF